MAKLTKRMRVIREKVDATKQYDINEAIALLKELATAKFVESVDVAVNLGIDARKSDQNVRGATVLPHGTGRSVRVAVFTQGANAEAAKAAGAELVGMEDLADQIKQELATSEEIDKLVSTINLNDSNTIVKFGAEAAEEISKASDQVLKSMTIDQVNDTGVMLKELASIMDKFDIKEIQDEKPGFFGNLKKKLEKIIGKYETMGSEVDRIYVQLKKYENEIGDANTKLDNMYDANLGYYQELVKYIMAGEQAVKELDQYIADYTAKCEANPDDGTIRMDLSNLTQMREILDQRVMDLKVAENVAIQTVPMLKTMEYSNLNLVRKINSA